MFTPSQDQPIIAVCTPRGSGALALLRISGADTFKVLEPMVRLSSENPLSLCTSHTIHHGYVVDSKNNGEKIDEVLFSVMYGPKTFTGEDTLEITCHNNEFIVQKIMSHAHKLGVRLAQPGEFSRRAVLNGKMDVMQAEAINDVISARSEHALKASLGQLSGTLSSFVVKAEHELTKLLGIVEASFEFLDEEQRDVGFDDMIVDRLKNFEEKLHSILDTFKLQQQIKDGVRVALVGSVNAGKSTLFNALLNKDRAIVTDIEGTTRDSIEAGIYRNGMFITFVDTAGLRSTDDTIEQQGIDRSWSQAAQADVVIIVVDASKKLTKSQLEDYTKLLQQYPDKTVMVANKIDSVSSYRCPLSDKFISVSAHNKTGLSELMAALDQKVEKLFSSCTSPFLLNTRQHALLSDVATKLEQIRINSSESLSHELVAHHLRECLETLGQLTGKTIQENVFDSIFNDFCVGK